MLRIVLKKGYIGIPDKQRKTLEALGLKRIGTSVTREDNRALQGMLTKVAHLVAVEKVTE
ncbi:MAG: 50S ribosomal protein L30 [Nitrospiraceae bacterium]|nr:50S ribosomal protein L30 [Nitrospiraceae bacterium]